MSQVPMRATVTVAVLLAVPLLAGCGETATLAASTGSGDAPPAAAAAGPSAAAGQLDSSYLGLAPDPCGASEAVPAYTEDGVPLRTGDVADVPPDRVKRVGQHSTFTAEIDPAGSRPERFNVRAFRSDQGAADLDRPAPVLAASDSVPSDGLTTTLTWEVAPGDYVVELSTVTELTDAGILCPTSVISSTRRTVHIR